MQPECRNERPDLLAQVDALRDLLRCLALGQPVPMASALRLVPGLDACLRSFDAGEDASLDAAFGLRRRGGIVVRKALANAERDKLLRGLWANHPDWAACSVSHVSRVMATEFQRYQTTRWKREKSQPSAPAKEPYCTFWRLLKAGSAVPSAERLRKILTGHSMARLDDQRSEQ